MYVLVHIRDVVNKAFPLSYGQRNAFLCRDMSIILSNMHQEEALLCPNADFDFFRTAELVSDFILATVRSGLFPVAVLLLWRSLGPESFLVRLV